MEERGCSARRAEVDAQAGNKATRNIRTGDGGGGLGGGGSGGGGLRMQKAGHSRMSTDTTPADGEHRTLEVTDCESE